MSYILDALRKSDEKRSSLNISATTSHYKQPQSTKDHRIQWIIAAFFIAAGSSWFIIRLLQPETIPTTTNHISSTQLMIIDAGTNTRKPQPEPPQLTATQTSKPPEKPKQSPKVQKTRILQPELIPDQVIPAIPEQETDYPDSARVELTSIPPSLLTDDREPAKATAHIPSRSELPPNQQNALPAISIAGHIYDETPSGRMVIINGKVSREKQHFGNGLVLEEITADGVILNHRGTVFRMGIFE